MLTSGMRVAVSYNEGLDCWDVWILRRAGQGQHRMLVTYENGSPSAAWDEGPAGESCPPTLRVPVDAAFGIVEGFAKCGIWPDPSKRDTATDRATSRHMEDLRALLGLREKPIRESPQ